MKHLMNTLYVTTEGSYISKDGTNVVVSINREERLRVPAHILDSVVCFGNVTCTPFVLGLCSEHQVTVSFLTSYGRFLARVHGRVHGNVLLRKEQYRQSDQPPAAANIARLVVLAKIANCRTVLLRSARDRPADSSASKLRGAAQKLSGLAATISQAAALETIRGTEGMAALEYFGAFDNLISAQKEDFSFKRRTRRPPLDPVNALLSFLYTLLVHDVSSALECVGLDPAVGFLHRDRSGRPSLALDLMEELRPVVADRLALSLINRKQITRKDFITSESGAVVLTDNARKLLLTAYQERKKDELQHPFLGEKVAFGLLPHVQSLLLARHLRGDLDAYPPFIWK